MKNKKDKILIGYLIFTGLVIFFYGLTNSIYYAPSVDTTIEIKNISYEKNNISKNINTKNNFTPKIDIPSIGISAKIQYVGLTKNGNMATPNNFFDVGLYEYGTNPGETGSAVIAGHVNNGLGLKAVFGDLHKIKYGDDIYIEMEKDKITHFLVISMKEYNYDEKVDEVFNQNDNSYVKLITCSGLWIKEINTHNKRIVVTAVKI